MCVACQFLYPPYLTDKSTYESRGSYSPTPLSGSVPSPITEKNYTNLVMNWIHYPYGCDFGVQGSSSSLALRNICRQQFVLVKFHVTMSELWLLPAHCCTKSIISSRHKRTIFQIIDLDKLLRWFYWKEQQISYDDNRWKIFEKRNNLINAVDKNMAK